MADNVLLKQMGERISARRKSLKLTQEALAEKIGVSTQMISNLELGKKAIRPENLVKLCEALELSADFILTGCASDGRLEAVAEKLSCLAPHELKIIEDILTYMKQK